MKTDTLTEQKQASGSVLTRSQKKKFGPKRIPSGDYSGDVLVATVRHDDECGNGHNSFSITGHIYSSQRYPGEATIKFEGKTLWMCSGGCVHEAVAATFPELAPFIRWHLSSTDEPMHYVANGLYWAGHKGWRDGKPNSPPHLEHLKSTIVYGALESDASFDLADHIYSDSRGFTWNEAKGQELERWLLGRLQALQSAFRADVEKLGLVW